MPALPLSRYEFADVHVDDDGRTFFDVPDPISRRMQPDDSRTTIGQGDTSESLAWRFYRALLDPELAIRPAGFFWVIAQFNDVTDATIPLESGVIMRAPSIQRLQGEITAPPQFFSGNESL